MNSIDRVSAFYISQVSLFVSLSGAQHPPAQFPLKTPLKFPYVYAIITLTLYTLALTLLLGLKLHKSFILF